MTITGSSARPVLPLALVVGAGGMGLAIARRLGQRHRLLLADRDANHLARVIDSLRAEGHDATGAACDVADPGSVTALAAQAAAAGPMRVLTYVVGLSHAMGDWRAIMKVDLIGAALVETAMLPLAGQGHSRPTSSITLYCQRHDKQSSCVRHLAAIGHEPRLRRRSDILRGSNAKRNHHHQLPRALERLTDQAFSRDLAGDDRLIGDGPDVEHHPHTRTDQGHRHQSRRHHRRWSQEPPG